MAGLAVAPQREVVNAVRVSTPPTIDGVVDTTKEWPNSPTMTGMVDMDTKDAAPEAAQIWLAYDDKNLYFAARMHDTQPKTIRAHEYKANVTLTNEDFVELDVCPSGNLSDYDAFQMNANGATNVHLAGGRADKREWVGDIVTRARIVSNGWEVEASIPWKLFRLPGSGKHDIRMNVSRYMPRTNRTYIHAYINDGLLDQTPVVKDVQLPQIGPDRSINLLPYVLAGYDADQGRLSNFGLDMKTNLSQSVTMVGSVNPDFRNIENNILSLDFSRFQRLAGETRPFFQEGADYLGSNIFSSQFISRFDVGLNAYGKLDPKTQFGFLNTTSFGKEENVVATATYSPDAVTSYRAAVTKHSASDTQNLATLFRYQKSLGSYNVFFRDERSSDSLAGEGSAQNADIGWGHSGLYAELDYDRVTPNFAPRLGFQPEVDYIGPSVYAFYQRQFAKGPFFDRNFGIITHAFNHLSGGFYRDEIQTFSNVTFRNQLNLGFSTDYSNFQDDHDHTISVSANYPRNDQRKNVSVSYTAGMEAEQRYHTYSASANYLYRDKLSTSLSYQIVQFGLAYSDQAILSGTYDLGHDRSVSGRILEQTGATNLFLSFQQSGNRGVEYYVILGAPNADSLVNPRYLVNMRTSLALKVVMPFRVGA